MENILERVFVPDTGSERSVGIGGMGVVGGGGIGYPEARGGDIIDFTREGIEGKTAIFEASLIRELMLSRDWMTTVETFSTP